MDNAVSGSLITEDLKGSQVVETKELPQFNAVEWTLANGAKVIFRKADFEKDNVALNAYSAVVRPYIQTSTCCLLQTMSACLSILTDLATMTPSNCRNHDR